MFTGTDLIVVIGAFFGGLATLAGVIIGAKRGSGREDDAEPPAPSHATFREECAKTRDAVFRGTTRFEAAAGDLRLEIAGLISALHENTEALRRRRG